MRDPEKYRDHVSHVLNREDRVKELPLTAMMLSERAE